MEWTSERIKQLRRRMGWSQSDLARRLSCESRTVIDWEQGKAQLPRDASQILEVLFKQSEMAAYEITQSCELEKRLKDENLETMNSPERED